MRGKFFINCDFSNFSILFFLIVNSSFFIINSHDFCFFLPLILGAISFYLYSIYGVKNFFEEKIEINEGFTPPISILKPLCGLEDNLKQYLISFIEQDYPLYQVVFCVRDPDDPVIILVEELIASFPDHDLTLIKCDRIFGYNYKVSNLINGLPHCDYDFILIADSDIEVKSDYLKTIIQPFQEEKIGVVTCLYQSMGNDLISILESLNMSGNFIPRVLTAKQLEGVKFAFGSTILIRKKVLAEIGNFEQLSNNIADDFLLGNLPTKIGYQVKLVNYIVTHHIGKETFKNYLTRRIRWLKCIRVQRLGGYLGMIFTQGIVTITLFFIVTQFNLYIFILLLITYFIRLKLAYLVGIKYLSNPNSSQYLGLTILVDFISFYVWIMALFGNKIKWREHEFIVNKNGELSLLSSVSS